MNPDEKETKQFPNTVNLYAPDGSVFSLPAHTTLDTYTRKGYKIEPDEEWHQAKDALEKANAEAAKKREEEEERQRVAAEIQANAEAQIAALYEEADEEADEA